MKNHKLSNNSNNNLIGVKSPIKLLIQRSLTKSPHDFGIPNDGGARTSKRQNELYSIGRTVSVNATTITQLDGYKKKSVHQFGMAFDVFIYDEHGACWSCRYKYEDVATIIKKEFSLMQKEGYFCSCEKLTWGGDWKSFKDFPHFQITKK